MSFDLHSLWFLLVGLMLAVYTILDGFDLGVGMLHVFTKGDEERRISLNSIGPVWDGNQVWLVVGGGSLFAAFPEAYATAFSGFYDAFILFLLTLILRGVSIKFRSKRPSPAWRSCWDFAFALGSFGAAFLLGVAFGNIAKGVPIDAKRNVTARFVDLLDPYALLVGTTGVSLLALHGAIYLVLKTESALQSRVRRWIRPLMIAFLLLYGVTTIATLLYNEHLVEPYRRHPWLGIVPLATVLAIANIPRTIHLGREFTAFVFSGISIGLLIGLVAIGLYPNLIFSLPDREHSLTIYNAASSAKTLKIMLIMVAIGMPMVLTYTVAIYWVFRGKVRLDSESY